MSNFTMPVDLHASRPVHSVAPGASIQEAGRRLTELVVSSLAVTDADDRLVGVISRTDLLELGREQAGSGQRAALLTLPDQPVSEVMTAGPLAVDPDTPVGRAARLMC